MWRPNYELPVGWSSTSVRRNAARGVESFGELGHPRSARHRTESLRRAAGAPELAARGGGPRVGAVIALGLAYVFVLALALAVSAALTHS